MLNFLTKSWHKHRLLALLKHNFELEEWNSLVRANTWDEMEEFLRIRRSRLEKLVWELVDNGEILAVDNHRAFILNSEKGLAAVKRQKYLQFFYRCAAGGAVSAVVGLIVI